MSSRAARERSGLHGRRGSHSLFLGPPRTVALPQSCRLNSPMARRKMGPLRTWWDRSPRGNAFIRFHRIIALPQRHHATPELRSLLGVDLVTVRESELAVRADAEGRDVRRYCLEACAVAHQLGL